MQISGGSAMVVGGAGGLGEATVRRLSTARSCKASSKTITPGRTTVPMRFMLVSGARGAIAKVAAVGVFVAVPATALAVAANADPANPDPFNPGDCAASASAACNIGPYGPDSPSNPDNPANPLSPLNPANPLSPMNPANAGF